MTDRRRKVRFAKENGQHVLTCPDCSVKIRSDSRGTAVLLMIKHGRSKHKWGWTEDVW